MTTKTTEAAACPNCKREALYFDSDGTYAGEVRIYRENVGEYAGQSVVCDRCEQESILPQEMEGDQREAVS